MRIGRPTLLLLALALLLMLAGAPVRAQLAIVTSAPGGAHAESLSTLRAKLQATLPGTRIDAIDWSELSRARLDGSRVVVSIGTLAARAVERIAPTQPVLHILLPAAAYHNLPPRPPGTGPVSAIWLDQPPQRQLRLIRLALPDWDRVAVLASADGGPGVEAIRGETEALGLTLTSARVGSDADLYPALREALTEPAVLIATPDPLIFNSYSVQNVLLAAYGHRSPVLGLSPAYVRAGALLGLYSTPAQIGTEAAGIVRDLLLGKAMPPPSPPSIFAVAINAAVARSLEIELPPAEQLTAALMAWQEDDR